jgi:hypothetical protein
MYQNTCIFFTSLPFGYECESMYKVIKSMDFTLYAQEKIPSVNLVSGYSLLSATWTVPNVAVK